MSAERVVYSIQRTYILTHVLTPEREIVTCDERIDIPTIEPLPGVRVVFDAYQPLISIPCIELAGEFLSDFNFTFETNEGVTVLPIKIERGQYNPGGNPYSDYRYVLVLPRGATGVKSCKLIHKATGKEAQHNFTFGVMHPPYNYDNALFGYLSYQGKENKDKIHELDKKVNALTVTIMPPSVPIELPKGEGKQTINVEGWEFIFDTSFDYTLSPEPTMHKPKITLRGGDFLDHVYTLSLNKTINPVSIDLFTGMITVYDDVTGEIMEQFKIPSIPNGIQTLSFEDFDDIDTSAIYVKPRGVRVE